MKKTQVTKPLGLIRKELQDNIVETINQSGLNLTLVSYILKEILEQVNATVIQQDNAEIAEYQAKLAENDEDV